ncbi:hypothetical protein KH5_07490 [Urechidicola sp. KH5]
MKIKQLIVFVVAVILSSFTFAQNEIPWRADQRLSWVDFEATPDETIDAYAVTSTMIQVVPEQVMVDANNRMKNYRDLTVEVYFIKNRSWVLQRDDNLLKHEQLHFDIAALYAQKIKRAFKKLQNNKVRDFDAYLNIYENLFAESRKVQGQYDNETNHGIDTDANAVWTEKIHSQLEDKPLK